MPARPFSPCAGLEVWALVTGRGRLHSCVVNLFDSLETVKQVADPDYNIPGFELEEKILLRQIEPVAQHSEVAVCTG